MQFEFYFDHLKWLKSAKFNETLKPGLEILRKL